MGDKKRKLAQTPAEETTVVEPEGKKVKLEKTSKKEKKEKKEKKDKKQKVKKQDADAEIETEAEMQVNGDDVTEEEKEKKKSKKHKKEKKEKKEKKKDKEADDETPAVTDNGALNGQTDNSTEQVTVADKKEKKEKKEKKKKSKKAENEQDETTEEVPVSEEQTVAADGHEGGQQINNNNNKPARFIAFVGNLPFTATVESVQNHFSKNPPSSVRVATEKTNPKKCRGFGFVEFDNFDRMKTCLKLYHHSSFDDGKSPARRINVELTAGGGGKSEHRKSKIEAKNKKLEEERQRAAKELHKGKGGNNASNKRSTNGAGGVEDAGNDQDGQGGDFGNVHPSRRTRMHRS